MRARVIAGVAGSLALGIGWGCGGSSGATADGAAMTADAFSPAAPQPDAAAQAVSAADARPGCVPTGPEICDGQDNDCDGVIDNGFSVQGSPVGSACYPGVGACINKGTVVCTSPSSAGCTASVGSPDESYHAFAAPNGSWDWNCNNNVDRKYPLASCDSFTASNCPAQGWTATAGQSGDCGEELLQQACGVAGGGCVATGAGTLVTEECK